MWYKIDWNIFVLEQIPIVLRKTSVTALAQALLNPLRLLYQKWYDWRLDNIYKIEHTGQVCYLRGSLNDRFDKVDRRIKIGDGLLNKPLYIFTIVENQEVLLKKDNEADPTLLLTQFETGDTGIDFIVYVPKTIYEKELDALEAHIKFYKAGGKRYKIFINE